jgi:hypothetical protein
VDRITESEDEANSGEGAPPPSPQTQEPSATAAASPGASPAADAQTSGEHVEGLDRDLVRSLEEIDGILLEEQQRLAREAGAAPGGSGAGATAPGEGGTSDRTGGDASGDGSSAGTDTTGGSEAMPAGGGETRGNGESTEAGGGTHGDDRSRVPPDVGDGSDDDIVARQLREAATEEDDPELRERLWEEYREYKRSISGEGDSDEN